MVEANAFRDKMQPRVWALTYYVWYPHRNYRSWYGVMQRKGHVKAEPYLYGSERLGESQCWSQTSRLRKDSCQRDYRVIVIPCWLVLALWYLIVKDKRKTTVCLHGHHLPPSLGQGSKSQWMKRSVLAHTRTRGGRWQWTPRLPH